MYYPLEVIPPCPKVSGIEKFHCSISKNVELSILLPHSFAIPIETKRKKTSIPSLPPSIPSSVPSLLTSVLPVLCVYQKVSFLPLREEGKEGVEGGKEGMEGGKEKRREGGREERNGGKEWREGRKKRRVEMEGLGLANSAGRNFGAE